ncbi:MAG: triose-phosphate isomerase [Candidatus Jorgensenbacteria bacterium]|nr:triose-phosphate isomerase [Candidatus Jorgensenbacteria bacterium]
MKKLLIANWKMKPKTLKEAIVLAKLSDDKDIYLAPPYIFLQSIKNVLKKATIGAQDLFQENPPKGGAFTGAVSAAMLKSIGIGFVILGHSERRALGETDVIISKKIAIACESKITPVLCVGESEGIRKKGIEEAMRFVAEQIKNDVSSIPKTVKKMIVAYEPIWAIGTGNNDTPESASQMARHIKKILSDQYSIKAKVLYGGSVNSKNISEFAKESDIDGFLVGGASADPKEFKTIIKIIKSI